MLKRTISLISKAKAIRSLPATHLEVAPRVLSKIQNASFSSVFKTQLYQSKSLHSVTRFNFGSLPSHQKLAMPALSPTMESGNIIKWNYKEGDKVVAGDAICEVETDKATLGFEVQDEGIIAKILLGDGTKGVKVGTPIVILVDSEGDIKAFKDYKAEGGDSAPAAETKKTEPKEEKAAPKEAPKQEAPKQAAHQGGHQHHSENTKGVPRTNVMIRFGRPGAHAHGEASHGGRVSASPLARRIAKEKNVDLSQVKGSGPNGRILKHDVLEYKPKPAEAPAATEKAAAKTEENAKPQAKPTAAPGANYTDLPIKEERQDLNKAFLDSKLNIPYYYLKAEVQLDTLNEVVTKLNALAKSDITVNDLFIKAAALAMKEVPEVNSHWHGKFIRRYENADIAITVDTPEGAITPVIRNANAKGLKEISSAAKKLAEKATTGAITVEECENATFTISNLSNTNVTYVTDIIIQPQACLLGLGKKGKKVIPAGDSFKEVNVINCTLTCDHRVVDGAVGAKWLQVFKTKLENPLAMLL